MTETETSIIRKHESETWDSAVSNVPWLPCEITDLTIKSDAEWVKKRMDEVGFRGLGRQDVISYVRSLCLTVNVFEIRS